jgi:peptidoglycan/LPS O-acetylase OafA/YrhL
MTAPIATPRPGRVYLPALDGVRALAVIAVMLYHGSGLAPGGFLGVDVFFVLSGFLITSLLLQEYRKSRRIEYGAFLKRRARRLLPALCVLLLGVSAYAAWVALPPERGPLRFDALASLAYVTNWRFIFSHTSYFGADGPASPLRHMWSLAIEEQYYLVWPLIVIAVLRRHREAVVGVCAALLAAGSAALCVVLYSPGADPSRVYFGTDTRAQALLIGSAVGVFAISARGSRMPLLARRWLGWAGFIVVVFAVAGVHDTSTQVYRGGLTVAALAAAAFVFGVATTERTVLVAALSTRPLRYVGRISYGLYLYHWPVFVWLTADRAGVGGARLFILRFGVTFVIAAASYAFIERPIRERGLRVPRLPRAFRPAAVASLAAVVAMTIVASTTHTQSWKEFYLAASQPKPQDHVGQPRVLIAGDSTAFTLGYNIDSRTDRDAYFSAAAIIGCGLMDYPVMTRGVVTAHRSACDGLEQHWQEAVTRDDPDLVVIADGPWDILDQVLPAGTFAPGSAQYAKAFEVATQRAVDIFTSGGARVVILDVPCMGEAAGQPSDPRTDPKRQAAMNAVFDTVASHDPNVQVLRWSEFLCPGGRYTARVRGVTLRPDGAHFDATGAHATWQWLGPRLLSLARAAQHERGTASP